MSLRIAVWHWYLTTQGTKVSWPSLPWYQSKKTPSFADALASLRRDTVGQLLLDELLEC